MEKAYNRLSMNDAAQLLSIKSLPELSAFATEVRFSHVINKQYMMEFNKNVYTIEKMEG
jgi:hypothetical protein